MPYADPNTGIWYNDDGSPYYNDGNAPTTPSPNSPAQPEGTWTDEGGILRNADGSPLTLGGPKTAPAPTGETNTTQGGGTGGSGGGGTPGGSIGGSLTAPFTEPFTPPSPVNLGGPGGIPYVPPTPQFQGPGYTKPPAFSYQDWKAPSFEDAVNSPGYRFRESRGMNGLQSWAAGKGTLNDSNTGKALAEYNQNLASAEYKNVWDRDYASYGMNRSNALSQYNTNYGTQYVDPYNFANASALTQNSNNMEGYRTQASAGQYQTNADYQNAFNKWLTDHSFFTDQRDSTWSKNWQYANS